MFEKVNPCHPDKVADRIAGAIVDLCYTKCKDPKVACEVLIGHGRQPGRRAGGIKNHVEGRLAVRDRTGLKASEQPALLALPQATR